MTDLDRAYWNEYWGDKMSWEDFVNFVSLNTPPQTLMAKLGINRRSYYQWRKKALQEIQSVS